MKKNVLIADTARRRLAPQLDKLVDKIEILEMHADGTVRQNGNVIDGAETPIHLAWFSRDVLEGGYASSFFRLTSAALDLEWMQTLNAGLDSPVFKKLAQKGIRLSNSNAQAPSIAEYVVASVLHRYQNFELRRDHQASSQWEGNDFREICGSHWMIIGFGNIGRQVGERVQAFQAHVTGVKRSVATVAGADSIIRFEDIPAHLSQQDVIVLSCALTDDTRDMVNAEFLAQLKPGAVLVNIGRGGLIDEDALITTLDKDAIDYAILDVFKQEPLPESSVFWKHKRVLVTPHSSNRGQGTHRRGDELFLHNLEAYTNGDPLRNEVDMSTLL